MAGRQIITEILAFIVLLIVIFIQENASTINAILAIIFIIMAFAWIWGAMVSIFDYNNYTSPGEILGMFVIGLFALLALIGSSS